MEVVSVVIGKALNVRVKVCDNCNREIGAVCSAGRWFGIEESAMRLKKCCGGNSGLNSKINSLDDDFSLGAEAIQLSDHHRNRIRVLPEHPRLKTMYMGDSMTSTSTAKTSSSISEILTLYQADAENILYNLGFACDKMCSMYEIPSRFFLCPSQATGIDFKMFFESLLHRIKKGDPTYLPADHDILKDTVCTFNKLYPCRTRTLLKKPGNIGIWTYSDFLFT
ncbi:protein TESPA1 isoform 2-T2 [Mantella aurantiaca]